MDIQNNDDYKLINVKIDPMVKFIKDYVNSYPKVAKI